MRSRLRHRRDRPSGKAIARGGPVTVRRNARRPSRAPSLPGHRGAASRLEDLRLASSAMARARRSGSGPTQHFGGGISCELIRTEDFKRFELIPITGIAAEHKGWRCSAKDRRPLRDGRPPGRGECFLHYSDRLDHWEAGELLFKPRFPWELSRSAIAGRRSSSTRVAGADPTASARCANIRSERFCSTSRTPPGAGPNARSILSPLDHEREGYVPNVVYSCGGMRIGATCSCLWRRRPAPIASPSCDQGSARGDA